MSPFVRSRECNGYVLVTYCLESTDPFNDSIDVEVRIGQERYSGTFFTPTNISHLLEKWQATHEETRGTYFWCHDMVLIPAITEDSLMAAVDRMIERNELERVLTKLEPLEEELTTPVDPGL